MRYRILPIILLFLFFTPLIGRGAEDSILQMLLVNSLRFQSRVLYLAVNEAITVLTEPSVTACHAQRLILAQEVMSGAAAQRIALAISRSNAEGRVILGTVTSIYEESRVALMRATNDVILHTLDKTRVDSLASDSELSSAIRFYWNSVAKCYMGLN